MNKTITTAELIQYLKDAPQKTIQEIKHDNGAAVIRKFTTPLPLKSYIDINFKLWYFYKVIKAGRGYRIYQDGILKYEYKTIE